MKKVILITAIAAALSGCGSAPLVGVNGTWIQGSEKQDVLIAPAWFTEILTKDDGYIFANGSEYSIDLQFAIDKATLSAKSQLASQVNSTIESMMKEYTAESGLTGDSDIQREVERTTRTITNTQIMVGFKREKIEIRREGKGYRVFTRMIFPYNDTNKLMAQAIKDNKVLKNKFDSSKAFRELDRETAPAAAAPAATGPTVSERSINLPHTTISDQGVKKRVEDAIARGDAVIISDTVR